MKLIAHLLQSSNPEIAECYGKKYWRLRLSEMYVKSSFVQSSVLKVTQSRDVVKHLFILLYLKCFDRVGRVGVKDLGLYTWQG